MSLIYNFVMHLFSIPLLEFLEFCDDCKPGGLL